MERKSVAVKKLLPTMNTHDPSVIWFLKPHVTLLPRGTTDVIHQLSGGDANELYFHLIGPPCVRVRYHLVDASSFSYRSEYVNPPPTIISAKTDGKNGRTLQALEGSRRGGVTRAQRRAVGFKRTTQAIRKLQKGACTTLKINVKISKNTARIVFVYRHWSMKPPRRVIASTLQHATGFCRLSKTRLL